MDQGGITNKSDVSLHIKLMFPYFIRTTDDHSFIISNDPMP